MMTCTCRKSHPDKHYTFTEVEIDENRSCIHCGYYAVEFPDTADLARPNHYLLNEAGHRFYRHCTKCGEATRIEDMCERKMEGSCKACELEYQRLYNLRTGYIKKGNKRFKGYIGG